MTSAIVVTCKMKTDNSLQWKLIRFVHKVAGFVAGSFCEEQLQKGFEKSGNLVSEALIWQYCL